MSLQSPHDVHALSAVYSQEHRAKLHPFIVADITDCTGNKITDAPKEDIGAKVSRLQTALDQPARPPWQFDKDQWNAVVPGDVVKARRQALQDAYNKDPQDTKYCNEFYADPCSVTVNGEGTLTTPDAVRGFLDQLLNTEKAKNIKFLVTKVTGDTHEGASTQNSVPHHRASLAVRSCMKRPSDLRRDPACGRHLDCRWWSHRHQ